MNPSIASFAIKMHEQGIFGNGTNLTKIQKLFAKISVFKNFGMASSDARLVDESNAIQNALEAEIDKATPNPDSPDYKKFLAMKASAIGYKSEEERAKTLPDALAALEPIKFDPEVSLTYVVATLQLANKVENADYFLNAEAVYDHYKKNGTPCLSTYQIFGAKISCIEEENETIALNFFEAFLTLKNDALQRKYVLPAIKSQFDRSLTRAKLGIFQFKFEKFLPTVKPHIECLIASHYFAQLDHLLSIFMFHLVKAGRATGLSTEEQLMIDSGKAAVSSWYTLWARKLILSAKAMETDPDYVAQNPIRTEMFRYDEFWEPGVEIYENQFPIEFIRNEKEWKKVMNRGKLWCQRAAQYFESNTAVAMASNFYRTDEKEDFRDLLKLFNEGRTVKPEFLN
ncbi:uncharacterized protein LOC134834349 [Culicoides brevitarsis]|uniref:uncharacterized protein LOC134834349 n=1 Tax=Culicoides brevitarsis TaxID=469753 RepID=UPI00307B4535